MKRRDFLRTAGGTATAAAAMAGNAAAQEGTETGTASGAETGTASGTGTAGAGAGTGTGTGTGGGGGTGSGVTRTVEVGPGGSLVYTPGTDSPLRIAPGTTVRFVWESDNHNIVPGSVPEGATWEGTPGGSSQTFNSGYTYTHTFTTLGTYTYHCTPHETAGMVATIEVVENPQAETQKSLHELGVPIQAHYVGAATILGIIVTIIYTFFILKYGESPNTGNTGGGEGE